MTDTLAMGRIGDIVNADNICVCKNRTNNKLCLRWNGGKNQRYLCVNGQFEDETVAEEIGVYEWDAIIEQHPQQNRMKDAAWLDKKLIQADDGMAGATTIEHLSCFVCGYAMQRSEAVVQHLIHPDVVCCISCKQHQQPSVPVSELQHIVDNVSALKDLHIKLQQLIHRYQPAEAEHD